MPISLCLNQNWAGIYLQIIISILVYGLGLPAILMQIVVPDDLRHIVHEMRGWFKWGVFLIIPVLFIAVIFIWLLHPCQTDLVLPSYLEKPLAKVLLPQNQLIPILANILLTTSIMIASIFWWLQASYRRDRVIIYIRDKIINEKKTKDIWFEYLKLLGKNSKTRSESSQVINALKLIMSKIIEDEEYSGTSLDQGIWAVQACIKNTDISIVNDIIKIFDDFTRKIIAKDVSLINSHDMRQLLRALKNLGRIILEEDHAVLNKSIIQAISEPTDVYPALTSEACNMLMELTILSIQKSRQSFLIEALNKIEVWISQSKEFKRENLEAYLCIIAELWQREGSYRCFAHMRFTKYYQLWHHRGIVQGSQGELIDNAMKRYLQLGRFDLVDGLSVLATEWSASEV